MIPLTPEQRARLAEAQERQSQTRTRIARLVEASRAADEARCDGRPAGHHFIRVCRACCGIIAQCRCMGPKITRYGLCVTCRSYESAEVA